MTLLFLNNYFLIKYEILYREENVRFYWLINNTSHFQFLWILWENVQFAKNSIKESKQVKMLYKVHRLPKIDR